MTAKPRQRQEFARLVRTIRDMTRPPVFFARESNEEMEKKQKEYEKRKSQVLRRMAPMLKGIKKMAVRHPELARDFRKELKDIGL